MINPSELKYDKKKKEMYLPDYLWCENFPLTIVSDRVVYIWGVNGITGYESSPVKLVDKRGKEIVGIRYYNIHVTGKAELDFEGMGLEFQNICTKCGFADYAEKEGNNWGPGHDVIKENTYDGSDLFTFKHCEWVSMCTPKVRKIAHKYKLSNFKFSGFRSV